jgi:hypothetical protein
VRDDGLAIIELSGPGAGTVIATLATQQAPLAITVTGDHVIIGEYVGGVGGVTVIDVSDPEAPVITGTLETWDPVSEVLVHDSLVYCTGRYYDIEYREGSLTVIDISDPSSPTLAGALPLQDPAFGVAIAGDHAFVIEDGYEDGAGLQVVDISDPTSMSVIASSGEFTSGNRAAIDGENLFVAHDSGVISVDVSQPTAPVVVGHSVVPGTSRDIAISGDQVFLASGNEGVQVVDVFNPTSPPAIATIGWEEGSNAVAVDGDHAYVVDSDTLSVIDVSSPTSPAIVGTVGIGTGDDVAVAGGLAIVLNGFGYPDVQVIDVTDPTAPEVVGELDTGEDSNEVAFAPPYAYVVGSDGLNIIDVSDPEVPEVVGSYATPCDVIAIAAEHVFLAVSVDPEVQVVDVSTPTSPALVASIVTRDAVDGLAVNGDYLYAAESGDHPGVEIIDVSNPASPSLIETVDLPRDASAVVGSGSSIYVAASRLQVIDATEPVNAVYVGNSGTVDYIRDVAADAEHVYVAGNVGFATYPPQCPQPEPVELAAFEVSVGADVITVTWRTALEDDVLGFNVWRSTSATPGGAGDFDKLNGELVRARGDGAGTSYEYRDRAGQPGESYVYRLEVVDRSGATETFDAGPVTFPGGAPGPRIRELVLYQNLPNPFNPTTSIRFELPEAGPVSVRIYDTAGRLVRTLVDATLTPEVYVFEWDGNDDNGRALESGVYFYSLRAGEQELTRKLVMLR